MSEVRNDRSAKKRDATASSAKAKRPYTKPAFQHEKVFETMALACGKLSPTQAQCRFNRRNS
jgi:hypothetical protein